MLLAADTGAFVPPFASNEPYKQNELRATDTNNDGHLSSLDGLIVINELHQMSSSAQVSEESDGGSQFFLDPSGDGEVSPLDALLVINDLNAGLGGENGDVVRISAVPLDPNTHFNDADVTFSGDTIVRSDNGSWTADGFSAGDMILVSDSGEFFDVDIEACRTFGGGTCQFFNDPNDPDNPNNGNPIIGETTVTNDNGTPNDPNDDFQEVVPVLGDFDPDRNRHNNGMYTIQSVNATTITLTTGGLTSLPTQQGYDEDPNIFKIHPQDQAGDFQVPVNTDFLLAVTAEDLRAMDSEGNNLQDFEKGPFAVYTDIVFDASQIGTSAFSVNNVDFFNFIDSQKKGNITSGLFNGLGAAGFSLPGFAPLGAGKHLAFGFPMSAPQTTPSGSPLTVSLEFEDGDLPGRAVLLSGGTTGVPQNMIEFVAASIDVVSDISAGDDTVNVVEDTQNNNFNVLGNDNVFNPPNTDPVITQVNGSAVSQGQTVNVSGGQLDVVSLTSKNGTNFGFTPTPGTSGTVTFDYTASNGAGATAQATVTINVAPDQDAPVITIPNQPSVAEESSAVTLNTPTVTDADGDNLDVMISVTNGTLQLGGDSGATITRSGTSINLSGLQFTVDPNLEGPATATLTITADDGVVLTPVTNSASISITAVDDPTILNLPGDQVAFIPQDLIFSSGNANAITVADPDSNLTFTASVGQGLLNGQSSITLTGTAASITSQLSGLTFSYSGTAPFNTTFNASVTNGSTESGSFNIQVVPPSFPFAGDDNLSVNEGSGTSTLDVFATDLASSGNTISITELNGQPVNSITLPFGTVTNNGNNLSLTLTDNDVNGTASFTYTIEQAPDPGDLDAVRTATVNLTVNPVNDGPILTVSAGPTIDEDTPTFTSVSGITVTDVDADGDGGLTVNLTVGSGTLQVSGVGSGSALSLTGNVSTVQNQLDNLGYRPASNVDDDQTLSVSVSDNPSGGGAMSQSDTVNITINPINDPPTLVVPGKQSFFTEFDNRFSSDPNPFQIDDIDAGGDNVQVDLLIGDGTLTIGNSSGATVTQSPAGNGVRITGSITNVNNALASGVDYRTSTPGNKTLTATVDDLGNNGDPDLNLPANQRQTDTETVDVEVLDFVPVNLLGKVFGDINGDGNKDNNDLGIEGVEIRLSGTDFQGNPVDETTFTDQRGDYLFQDLRPSGAQPYVVSQVQPSFLQGGSGEQASVALDMQGNVTMNGSLSFTEGSFTPGFIDPYDIFALSGQSPFNSGIAFGMRGAQDWAIFFGRDWDMDQFSNARFHANADGFSGTLTVFDSQAGADRTANVSTQAGTLTFRGTSTDRVYRVIGGSSLLGPAPGAGSEGESSGDANSDANTYARAVDALFAGS